MSTLATITKLRERRHQLVDQGRKDNEARLAKGEEWSAEEQGRWAERLAEAEQLSAQIALLEKQRDLEASLNEGRRTDPDPVTTGLKADEPAQPTGAVTASPEYRAAYQRFLYSGRVDPILSAGLVQGPIPQTHGWMQAANSIDNDAGGGYLQAPMEMVNELIKTLDDELLIMGQARKFTLTKARSLGVPTRTAKASSAAWGGEVTQPTADTALAFGGRELNPHFFSGEVDVSRPFLSSAVLSPEAIVNYEIGRDSGELLEDAFLTGTGSGQPLGLFTASSYGISTSRDVSTGNTTTAMTWDGLKNAKGLLKFQYQNRCNFLTSRTGYTALGLLKDGNGRYLWQDSVKVGEPDTVLGRPAFVSERAPATFTTGLYVGLFYVPEYYWIARGLDLEIIRANELLVRTNQVAFVYRGKIDGMPVLEEAFARVKLA